MKLNLLPTYVSKEKGARAGIIMAVLMALVGIIGAVFIIWFTKNEKDKAHENIASKRAQVARIAGIAKSADTIISMAAPVILNINLADAMNAHNTVYPDLYDEVRSYIPSFFRVTSMSAAPVDASVATVTISGVLQTQQQYADLMLALLRIPGATSVTRDGYQVVSPQVPPLSEADQVGRPLRPGESPIPDDPEQRLNWYIQQGALTGFDSTGGFGSEPGPRGAMPNWSEVQVTVTLPRALMTPDPRATLTAGGSAGTGGGGGGNVPNPGGGPTGGGRGGGRDD